MARRRSLLLESKSAKSASRPDRFFAIAQELRQVIERLIQDNVLKLALRGQPRSPFCMVAQMGEQSVVVCAEKG